MFVLRRVLVLRSSFCVRASNPHSHRSVKFGPWFVARRSAALRLAVLPMAVLWGGRRRLLAPAWVLVADAGGDGALCALSTFNKNLHQHLQCSGTFDICLVLWLSLIWFFFHLNFNEILTNLKERKYLHYHSFLQCIFIFSVLFFFFFVMWSDSCKVMLFFNDVTMWYFDSQNNKHLFLFHAMI